MNPDISIFMAAARPKWWERMYESLKGNRCSYEIIAVGPNKPMHKLPDNFKFIHSTFKPCQAYAIASYHATGELIGWGCDDATYFDDSLDNIIDVYVKHGPKTIFAQVSIEDRRDTRNDHFFFWGCPDTQRMAPLAFLNRRWFWELGGYSRLFVAGQTENDLVMRAIEDGGKVELVDTSLIQIHHKQVHRFRWNYPFRSGYWNDRRTLEEAWLEDGYGTFNEKTLQHGKISERRLLPHYPFNYSNILIVAQGPQGDWEYATRSIR